MLNFLRKPLGYALLVTAHGVIANQVYYQFFPNQMPQLTWSMAVWSITSLYVFLTTFLLYRLLIKQEPFSKEFKKTASKYYTACVVIFTSVTFIGGKVLYSFNPDLAEKLVSANTLKLISQLSWTLEFVMTCIAMALMIPVVYWMNYGYLWLTDKIVNFFLKSKNA